MAKITHETVAQALSKMRLAADARPILAELPQLEQTISRFLRYVPRWVMINTERVAESHLAAAINRFAAGRSGGVQSAHRLFLEEIAMTASRLAAVRISALGADSLYHIWNYDEPLADMLASSETSTLQVRPREDALPVDAVLVKLLANIVTVDEMTQSGLNICDLMCALHPRERQVNA